jgi:3-oxoisoapionate decarboxylase
MSDTNNKQQKFACAAWGFRKLEIPEYFRIVANLGIESVEVNVDRRTPKHLLDSCSDEAVNQVAHWADEFGVHVICIAADNDFTVVDASDLEEQIQKVKRYVDIAKRLGAKVVRVFTGGNANENLSSELLKRLHYAFNCAGSYAEEHEIKLAIENHGGLTVNGQLTAKIMEGIKSPAVGVNFDPANFLKEGVDPLIALRYVLPWVNYSHWKDVRWNNGGTEYCAFGEGEIFWKPILQELLNSGYQGYWTVEYETIEDVERGTKNSFVCLSKMLQEIFSDTSTAWRK